MNKKFLKDYVEMYCDILPFNKFKKVGFLTINRLCEILSEHSKISEEKLDNFAKDSDVLEFTYCTSLLTNVIILKMCRIYYTIVGIIIGIITSLLFGYFMG